MHPSTLPNELNTTLTPHSIIHGDACFAYFNKIWGIPYKVSPSGRATEWYWEVTCCGVVARGLASTRGRAGAHALTAAASCVEAPSEDACKLILAKRMC
jgi:hypothetical protein